MVLQTVKTTIKEHKMIAPGDKVVLGVSGGPDSVCLLHVLAGLQLELGFGLYALHVNHQIRGEEANEDLRYVAMCCKELDVPLTLKVADVPSMAEEEGISVEEMGRKVRQKALERKAAKLRAEMKEAGDPGRVHVCLAHNKDDQAETVLMRVIRGTGVHGLAAMEYVRDDGLIRPLLDVPRADIEAYCRDNNLNPRTDSTNLKAEYTRNKIRLHLIPQLEKEYNPNIKDGLVRLAASAREDDKYINAVADGYILSEEATADSLSAELLAHMEPAVAKRIVKFMFRGLGLTEDIEATHINALLDGVRAGKTNATYEFPHGYSARLAYGRVIFRNAKSAQKPMRLMVYKLLFREEAPLQENLTEAQCLLDALKVAGLSKDLSLRTRRPGDAIRLSGMDGAKKIQDYMVDRKIPKDERDQIQMLCADSEVLWIPGERTSRLVKSDETTDLYMLVELIED